MNSPATRRESIGQVSASERSPFTLSAPAAHFLGATLILLCTVAVAAGLRHVVPILSVTNLFLVPVIISALRWGFGPALFVTGFGIVLGTLFYEPVLSVEVWTLRDIVDLVVFAIVGLVISVLGDGLRRSTIALGRQQSALRSLYVLSHETARARDVPSLLAVVSSHLSRTFGHDIAVEAIGPSDDGRSPPALPKPVYDAMPKSLQATMHETVLVRGDEQEVWLLTAIGQASGSVLAIVARLDQADAADSLAIDQVRSMLEEAAQSLERLGIAHQIEQQHLREKADAVRHSLLDAASHELRTPLATIQGVVTALRQASGIQTDQRLTELADLATDECQRLNRVIQDILDAGRIRSGALRARLMTVEVSDLVSSALQNSHLRLRNHRVRTSIPDDPPLVLVDPVLVEQALVNLLENAAKFSPAGTAIMVTVEADERSAHVSVADEGVGFADNETDQLFSRFYRGDRGKSVSGSGLGLSVAKSFVEASGGLIHAQSKGPGHGATLTISLPRSQSHDANLDDI